MKQISVNSHILSSLLESSAKLDNVSRLVVGGIIKNEHNEYLLLKRAVNDFNGGLELPSGEVEPDELILDALQRVIKEVTNLKVKSVDIYLGSFDYELKSDTVTRQFNFEVKVDEVESLKTSAEYESEIWATANRLHHYHINESVTKILLDRIQELVDQAHDETIKRLVVGGVIRNQEGKILLLKRAINDFMGGLDELPSGEVEAGESLISALIREIKEANLDVSSVHAYLGYFDYKSKSGTITRQFNFEVHKIVLP